MIEVPGADLAVEATATGEDGIRLYRVDVLPPAMVARLTVLESERLRALLERAEDVIKLGVGDMRGTR